MPRDFEFSTNAPHVAALIRQKPALMRRNFDRALRHIGMRTDALVQKRFTTYRPGKRPQKLMKRSGDLARSFRTRQVRPPTGIDGMASITATNHPAARIQEYGGTVRAKPGKYLAIPTEEALTPAGRLKAMAMLRKTGGKWVNFNDDPTFIRNGVIFVVPKRQKGRKPIPIRILKKSVTLEARFGIRELHERMRRSYIPRTLRRAVSDALRTVRTSA